MKKVLLFFVLISITGIGVSQEILKVSKAKDEVEKVVVPDSLKAWYLGGSCSFSFTQASFSNWSAGGQNSIGLDAFANFMANYHKGKHTWGNSLSLGYGFNILGKDKDADFTKTNDKIEFTSTYGYAVSKEKKWLLSALVNFRTQFSAGYNYPDDSTVISNFMAPGYLVAGVGFTYAPVKWFYVFMSPASGRFTFVMDQKLSDAGQFGVDRGKNVKSEFGPYIRSEMNKDLSKNINLSTTISLFTDYMKNFGNIDVDWNLLLTLKVNKWLAASIAAQLIYDDDTKIKVDPDKPGVPRTQFKELLGIGITYKIH
jgi:hypothetical protein